MQYLQSSLVKVRLGQALQSSLVIGHRLRDGEIRLFHGSADMACFIPRRPSLPNEREPGYRLNWLGRVSSSYADRIEVWLKTLEGDGISAST